MSNRKNTGAGGTIPPQIRGLTEWPAGCNITPLISAEAVQNASNRSSDESGSRHEEIAVPEKSQEIPRASARFSSSIAVEFHPTTGPSSEDLPSMGFEGVLQNISSGGACMITKRPLKVSEVLKVSFPIQKFISTPRALAEVKWTHPLPEGRHVSGLRFLL